MTKRQESYIVFASAAISGGLFVDYNHPACGAVLMVIGFAGMFLTYLSLNLD